MLPEKWCIRGCEKLADWITKRERELNVYINVYGSNPTFKYYLKRKKDLNSWDGEPGVQQNYKEITFEEFEKYVLNKTPEVKEDMSYLIKVLNRCNIK